MLESVSGAGQEDVLFANGYTYSGHPVSCAAALKNIEIIEKEGILDHVRRVSPHFLSRLHALRESPIVGNTRGLGLVGCVEGRLSKEGDRLALDREFGQRVDERCEALGLIVRPLVNMHPDRAPDSGRHPAGAGQVEAAQHPEHDVGCSRSGLASCPPGSTRRLPGRRQSPFRQLPVTGPRRDLPRSDRWESRETASTGVLFVSIVSLHRTAQTVPPKSSRPDQHPSQNVRDRLHDAFLGLHQLL
ncbi:MAG: aminotransferase class III-fold pyridoxal phosphate-dependent enzyme [Gammaproteobacteria bacterium]|nr:aminotransferase class III-fold pyridoxal phosphate-dependent enzyme [Gammaproteobacteria bacterium]